MPARLIAALCLTLCALVGVKLAGAAWGWWAPLPKPASVGLIVLGWSLGIWFLLARRAMAAGAGLAGPHAPPGQAPPAPAPPRRAEPERRVHPRPERRAHPRHAVDWLARAEWRDGSTTAGVLRNISRGGACIAGTARVPPGTAGALHVEGLTLPVPVRVVDWTAESGLHLAFEIDGLGLDAVFAQLDRALETAAGRG